MGRAILRNRGGDPNTIFGDPDDQRLALVPAMTDFLDSLNMEWNKQGMYVDSVAWMDRKEYEQLTQQQTKNGNTISISQNLSMSKKWNKTFDCLDQSSVFAVFGGMLGGAAAAKVSGAVIGSACGVSVTAGGAIGALGAGYYMYRMGDCMGDIWLRGGGRLAVDRTMQQVCLDEFFKNPQEIGLYEGYYGSKALHNTCVFEIRRQLEASMKEFKEKYGDTLEVAATFNN